MMAKLVNIFAVVHAVVTFREQHPAKFKRPWPRRRPVRTEPHMRKLYALECITHLEQLMMAKLVNIFASSMKL
jgi:hypothetical protein